MIFSRKDTKVNLSFSAKFAVVSSLIAVVILAASYITFDALSSSVTVVDGGSKETKIFTFKNTVEEVLSEEGVVLKKGDKVNFGMKDSLRDDMTIEVYRAMQVMITADGETHAVKTTKRKVSDILADAGYELTEEDIVTPKREKIAKADTNIVLVRGTSETICVTEETEFASTEKPNASMNYGAKKVIKEGKKGKRIVTYKISYADGVESGREVISETVLAEPEDRIVEVGTKRNTIDNYTIAYNGTTTSRDGSFSYSRVVQCNATAYDAVSLGKKPGQARTATGAIAQRGIIAVDPRFIPLGTRVYVEGYGYAIAADTGGAIKGNIIDLCMDSRAESLQWGRRNVTVYILD